VQLEAPPRTARKEETRRKLLDAALSLVAEKGFANASLGDIAARAGVTTGAVYSNFRSKEALLLGLIEMRMEGSPEDPAVFPPPGSPDKPLLQHLVDHVVGVAHFIDRPESRQLAVLQVEWLLMALRDESLLQQERVAGREGVRRLARALEQLDEVPPPGTPLSLEHLAQIFYAGVQGLEQHRLLDPDSVPDELFEWFVQAILYAASSRGVTAGRRASRRGSRR